MEASQFCGVCPNPSVRFPQMAITASWSEFHSLTLYCVKKDFICSESFSFQHPSKNSAGESNREAVKLVPPRCFRTIPPIIPPNIAGCDGFRRGGETGISSSPQHQEYITMAAPHLIHKRRELFPSRSECAESSAFFLLVLKGTQYWHLPYPKVKSVTLPGEFWHLFFLKKHWL